MKPGIQAESPSGGTLAMTVQLGFYDLETISKVPSPPAFSGADSGGRALG